jgi:hypothetical protein
MYGPDLPPMFWEAIQRALDYSYEVELGHYLETPADERDGHIFEALWVLKCWLELAHGEGFFTRLDS